MTKGHFIRLALFVVMTGHFSSAGGLRADELRAKLEAKLVEIKRDLFDTRGVASVAVGEFSGAANLEASGGPAISNALIDAFQKIGRPQGRPLGPHRGRRAFSPGHDQEVQLPEDPPAFRGQ